MDYREEAEKLVEDVVELQAQVLIKHTTSLLEEIHKILRERKVSFLPQELPEYHVTLQHFTEAMRQHFFWYKCQGTPLENDLPVIAARVFYELLDEAEKKKAQGT